MSSNKRPPQRQGKAKADQADDESFDWSSVFENGRIKSQIQDEDANVGVLPKKTLQLISTCSSLLLRKLVQESVKQQRQQSTSNNEEDDDNEEQQNDNNVLVLSAQDIQESVASMDHLGFLHGVLEQATESDDQKIARLKAPRKRKPPPPPSSEDDSNKKPPSKKTARIPGKTSDMIDDDCMKHALELSKQEEPSSSLSTDKITLDEEDYD